MRSTAACALVSALLSAFLCAAVSAQGEVRPSLLAPPPADAVVSRARQAGTAAIVAKARLAVVHIEVEVAGKPPFPIERPSSGVVVDASGLVVTWWSLVREADGASDKHVFVSGDGCKVRRAATIVGHDASTGLALLQVERGEPALTPLELADGKGDHAGEPVVALSCFDGKDYVAFAGVAAPALAQVSIGGADVGSADLVLSDAAIGERGHGGALVDSHGRLLGLFNSEHVAKEVSEPTLADLKRSSFAVTLSVSAIRGAFKKEFGAAAVTNATLREPPPPSPQGATAAAVAAARASVVAVWGGEGEPPAPSPLDPGAVRRQEHLGSGVIVARTGLVVTNLHLVAGRAHVKVTLADGRRLPAELIGKRANLNVALLQLQLAGKDTVPAIPCGDDAVVSPGAAVLGLGFPYGNGLTVTAGVLSAKRDGGRLQADPNLGNQNGGGALIDAGGRLLGIIDAGEIDSIDRAFAAEGDQAKAESNLSWCTGIGAVRKAFAAEIAARAAADDSIRSESDAAARARTPVADAVTALVAKSGPAMLNVYISWTSAAADAESNPFAETKGAAVHTQSLGSGVIIDPSGLAISNWHVVGDATEPDGSMKPDHLVHVRTFDGKTFAAKVLSISREDDLSLLQLMLPEGATVAAAELGDSDALQLGDGAVAIGNPHGLSNTITAGIVSALDQGIRVKGRWAKLDHLIETDAAINGGNSGGALLDHDGRVIGINSAGSHGISSRGYAIAVNHVRRQLLSLLLSPEKLRAPSLGLTMVDEGGKVVVATVDPDAPAGLAGVQRGDRVLSLGGVAVHWSIGWAQQLLRTAADEPVQLQLERGGKPLTIAVTPMSAEAWAVYRQTGLSVGTLTVQSAGERVQQACTALQRKFTGDANAAPATIPASLVQVERVHPRLREVDVQPGDLLLAVELTAAEGGEALVRFTVAAEVQRFFNDMQLGSYEGRAFRCWLARGADVRAVAITGKRLLW